MIIVEVLLLLLLYAKRRNPNEDINNIASFEQENGQGYENQNQNHNK